MKTRAIAVAVVKFKDKILLLKRTKNTRFAAGKWENVSGFLKEFETAEDCMIREIKEETGLNGKIVKLGNVFEAIDEEARWIIIPYLCEVESDKVRLSEEHEDFAWIKPKYFKRYDTVVDIERDLKSVGLI